MPKGVKEDLSVRFWRFVDKLDGEDACWVWNGCRDSNGYGSVGIGNKKHALAHRACWLLTKGVWPEKLLCHKCDNPSCVRPSHMFEGGQKENMKDMTDMGRRRSNPPRGEKSNFAKLTEPVVLEIRSEVAAGATQISQVRKYGVSKCCVNQIVRRMTWNHV